MGKFVEHTPAQLAGCCFAPSKEMCKRPPCPCNLSCWTPLEREAIAREQAVAARKAK